MVKLPLREMEIGGYWTDGPYRQRGPISDKFHSIVMGKEGRRWALPDHGFSHGIAVDGGPGSRGCGGSKVTFYSKDGEAHVFEAPWFSNPDALLKDTGIDLRDKTLTWGCIGRHRDHTTIHSYDSRQVICDLLWWDPVDEDGNGIPQVGTFDRVRDLGRKMAVDRDEILFVFSGSHGGSSCGHESPIPYRHSDFRNHKDAEQPYWDKYNAEFVVKDSYKLPQVSLDHVDLWLEGVDYTVKDIDIEKIRDKAGLVMEKERDYYDY